MHERLRFSWTLDILGTSSRCMVKRVIAFLGAYGRISDYVLHASRLSRRIEGAFDLEAYAYWSEKDGRDLAL